jgi:hypothetical protein
MELGGIGTGVVSIGAIEFGRAGVVLIDAMEFGGLGARVVPIGVIEFGRARVGLGAMEFGGESVFD